MELLEGGTTSLKTTKKQSEQNKLYLSCSTRTTHAATTIALPLLATHASVSEAPFGSLLPPAGSKPGVASQMFILITPTVSPKYPTPLAYLFVISTLPLTPYPPQKNHNKPFLTKHTTPSHSSAHFQDKQVKQTFFVISTDP